MPCLDKLCEFAWVPYWTNALAVALRHPIRRDECLDWVGTAYSPANEPYRLPTFTNAKIAPFAQMIDPVPAFNVTLPGERSS